MGFINRVKNGIKKRVLSVTIFNEHLEDLKKIDNFFEKYIVYKAGKDYIEFLDGIQNVITENLKSIIELFKLYQSGDQLTSEQLYKLGKFFNNNQLIIKDPYKAFNFYEKAAHKGDLRAMVELAKLYLNGEGVSKDPAHTIHWLKKSIEKGVGEASFYMGILFYYGIGVEKDIKQAIYWFKDASDKKFIKSIGFLGELYTSKPLSTQHMLEGIKLLNKGIEHNDIKSIITLGKLYQNGAEGIPKDIKESIYWYEKAASLGSSEAMDLLSILYRDGIDIEKDKLLYRYWAIKANITKNKWDKEG